MDKLLIALAFGLVLLIIYQILRFFTIYSIVRGKKRPTNLDSFNKINGILMLVFLFGGMFLVFWYSSKASEFYLPESASVHGDWIDDMLWMSIYITGIVFVVTQVLLFYFSYKYQYRPGRKAYFYPHNNKLEIAWTVVPAIAFIVMFIIAQDAWGKITGKAPDDAVLVEVVGQQFSWEIRYPGLDGTLGRDDYRLIDAVNSLGMDLTDRASYDDFTSPQLLVPKGRTVMLRIRAKDVIHSVYIPHFRIKMDAVPGMPTRFHFEAKYTTEEMRTKLGNPDFEFELACAEICGRGHFAMRMVVTVVEEEEFNTWYREQQSWLSRNPEYLSKVPGDLKPLARAKMENSYVDSSNSLSSVFFINGSK